MAPRATVKKQPTPQYGRELTIGFGLVNVPVKMKPLVETRRPVPGKGMCPEHGPNLTQVSVCGRGTDDEHVVENVDKLTGYPHPENPEQLVVVDADVVKGLAEARDGVGQVEKFVAVDTIDSTYLDKPFLIWPQAGGEQAFDLFAALLRQDGRAAIVNAVLQKQTETLVVRWMEELGCLVAETVRYEQTIRHEDVELVARAADARDAVDERMLAAAKPLLEGLAGVFDAGEAQDTWTPLMNDAIRAADNGETYDVPAVEAKAPVIDLMAALAASVEQAKPKKAKAKTTTRKKVAA
jgi:DNA end-binding protein Ku